MKKEYRVYVAKISDNRFKYGITKNITARMKNIMTTGYGKPKLILASHKLMNQDQAREFERFIRRSIVDNEIKNEYCNSNHVNKILENLNDKYGWIRHNSNNVQMDKLTKHKVGDVIKARIDQVCIDDAYCETVSYCMYAQWFRLNGYSSISIQYNRIRVNKDGYRYYMLVPDKAYKLIEKFDSFFGKDKKNIDPHEMEFEIVKVVKIKPVTFFSKEKRKQYNKTYQAKKRPTNKMKKRFHGLASIG